LIQPAPQKFRWPGLFERRRAGRNAPGAVQAAFYSLNCDRN